jgi:hypothetical protein
MLVIVMEDTRIPIAGIITAPCKMRYLFLEAISLSSFCGQLLGGFLEEEE